MACDLLSFCVFQLLEGDFKVEGWLSQQEESDTTGLGGITKSLQLVKQWTLDHVPAKPKIVNASNRFTISESGTVGISCEEHPSLSVMYPDTDRPPVILSNNKVYRSATFIRIRGKEYLAAASDEDGCLYLWDIDSTTPRKVFDPKLPMDKVNKCMNICKIDKNTIGYREVSVSLDGSRRVFILKTHTAEWTLRETLKLFTPHKIWDMCYTKMPDDTTCLLLCIPHINRVVAVEMEDGKTRWEIGEEQMGEKFKPSTVCTDGNDCAYVADVGQNKIHLLSAYDGTLIKRFDVRFLNIFCVRYSRSTSLR